MKRNGTFLIIALLSLMALPEAKADLINKQFVQPGGSQATTGIVFQGSRNMKNLGKRTGTVSSVVVPSLNPVTVIPALENENLRPKPRFGYGSDYRPQSSSSQSAQAQEPYRGGISAPVYQFRYSYPVYRDYFISSPYSGFYRPFGGCWNHSWSGFTSFSLSYGW